MEKNTNKNKRILIFVPTFPAISETFIARDISKLVELGKLDIIVARLKAGRGEIPDNLIDKIYTLKINLTSIIGGFLYFFSKPQYFYNTFLILIHDKTKNILGRIYLFLKSLAYTHEFQKLHPDEIHAHFFGDPSTIALVSSKILSIPFSINAHARDVTQFPTLPEVKAKSAKFIAVCNQNAFLTCKKLSNGNDANIFLIHHGHDRNKLFESELKIRKDTSRFNIFAGGTRLTEKKGIEYLIEASKLLRDRKFDHKVDLIGGGYLYKKFCEMIKINKLGDIFFIHGKGIGLPYSEVSQYYQLADIFVLPIINTQENDMDGIPTAIIEAALAKLPIITTNAGSVGELIENEITGLVVPQRDPCAIADAVEELYNNKTLRETISQNVYNKALDMFDADKNVSKLEHLLLI